jgi:type I restriction enzyme M protein
MRQDTGVDGDAQRISQLCWMFFLKIIDDQDEELRLLDSKYRSPIAKRFQWRTWAADPEGITGEELLAFVNNEMFPALKGMALTSQDRRKVVRDVFEDAYNYMKSGQLMRQVVNKINNIDFNTLSERQHFGEIYEQILDDLQSAGNAGEYYTPRAVTAFMAERIDPHPGELLLDPACGTGGFLTCSIRHMRQRYVKTAKHEERMQRGLRAVEKKQLPHMLCVTNMLLHGIYDPSFVRHDNSRLAAVVRPRPRRPPPPRRGSLPSPVISRLVTSSPTRPLARSASATAGMRRSRTPGSRAPVAPGAPGTPRRR